MIGTYGYKNVYLISTNKQTNKQTKQIKRTNERTDCCFKIETRDVHAIIDYILHFLCVKLEKNELFRLLKKYSIFDKKNQATHESINRKSLIFLSFKLHSNRMQRNHRQFHNFVQCLRKIAISWYDCYDSEFRSSLMNKTKWKHRCHAANTLEYNAQIILPSMINERILFFLYFHCQAIRQWIA